MRTVLLFVPLCDGFKVLATRSQGNNPPLQTSLWADRQIQVFVLLAGEIE